MTQICAMGIPYGASPTNARQRRSPISAPSLATRAPDASPGRLHDRADPGLRPEKIQCRLPATFVKVIVSLLPTLLSAPMMTTAINEAIRPYSMAVAPDSSRTNCSKD
jgi:hypothetical protein